MARRRCRQNVAVLALVAVVFVVGQGVLPRPNLYVGTRTHEAEPILTGLAWNGAAVLDNLRHACHHHHKLQSWGWRAHDGRRYGSHFVGDANHNVNLTSEYLQHDDAGAGCAPWTLATHGALVRKLPKHGGGQRPRVGAVSLFSYVAAAGATLAVEPLPGGATVIRGRRPRRDAGNGTGGGGGGGDDEHFALLVWESAGAGHPVDAARTHAGVLPPHGGGPRRQSPAPGAPELSAARTRTAALPPADVWRVEDLLHGELAASVRSAAAAAAVAVAAAAAARGAPVGASLDPAVDDAALAAQLALPVVPVLSGGADADSAGNNVALVQLVLRPPFTLQWAFLPPACAPRAAGTPTGAPAAAAAPNAAEWLRRAVELGLADDGVTDSAAAARARRAAAEATAEAARRAAFDDRLCATVGACSVAAEARLVAASGGTRPPSPQPPLPHDLHALAAAAVGNLLGSVTYYHGKQLVGAPLPLPPPPGAAPLPPPPPPTENAPHGLLASCPSRSFFPRGFLWDEGFHQLIVSQWDARLTAAVLTSWLSTADGGGWIAREQILGDEARSRVPPEFREQRSDIANPPTLLLPALVIVADALCGGVAPGQQSAGAAAAATAHADVPAQPGVGDGAAPAAPVAMAPVAAGGRLSESDAAAAAAFCARRGTPSWGAPPPTESAEGGGHSHERGGAATAAGVPPGCVFACRARAAPRLDAAARLPPAAALAWLRGALPALERNYAWLRRTQAGATPGSFRWRGATVGHNFASGLDDYPRGVAPSAADEHVDLLAWVTASARTLADLAQVAGAPAADVARYAADAAAGVRGLDRHWNATAGAFCDIGLAAPSTVAATPRGRGKHAPPPPPPPPPVLGHVCHVGYVSLLPLLCRLLPPDSPRLGALLDAMEDPARLWSPYGLRSLSAADALAGTGEDYWRGAAWINVNFLAVAALRHYAAVGGPASARCAALAQRLEHVVVGTVAAEYGRTGFLWENYGAGTGEGRGTHPFTGWTALVALMLAQRYPL